MNEPETENAVSGGGLPPEVRFVPGGIIKPESPPAGLPQPIANKPIIAAKAKFFIVLIVLFIVSPLCSFVS